jgi:hypothetical protein
MAEALAEATSEPGTKAVVTKKARDRGDERALRRAWHQGSGYQELEERPRPSTVLKKSLKYSWL